MEFCGQAPRQPLIGLEKTPLQYETRENPPHVPCREKQFPPGALRYDSASVSYENRGNREF